MEPVIYLVIGAGINGLCAAIALRKRNYNVTLIDQVIIKVTFWLEILCNNFLT